MDEGQLRTQLGRAIAARRKARGLTQEQLAEAAGFSTVWTGQLERGEGLPTLDGLVRLAEALGTDAALLLATATGARRRECDDELVAELVDMDPDAVEVLTIAARALKGRWPRPPEKP
jgi:transcriptional regulator with XRE-family HTH domain